MKHSSARTFIAPHALLPGGWDANVRLEVDADGTIARITPASPSDDATLLPGSIVPGMPNAHSHAFQRAFAGHAERRRGDDDSFWTWRAAMYGLAARITPDELEAIAAQAYVEMLEAGYTAVGEFHYVHHDVGGRPYARRSETSQRLLAAAMQTGIGITLLPVFYRWSGFGHAAPLSEQQRFITDVDGFVAIVDELEPLCRTPQRRLGIAPHSLRAAAPEELRALLAACGERDAAMPVHLHLAEQTAEVEACLAATGMRPVEWLVAHAPVGPTWCAVHATHADAAEVEALARTGATVALCPTTEANLGDGLFPLGAWLAASGSLAVGSDSQISIDVREEVRWLEYAQRLRHRRRAVAPSLEALYVAAARGGGRALGRPIGSLVAGARADFVVLDDRSPALCGVPRDALLDAYVAAGGRAALRDVYVGGSRVVADGRHIAHDAIADRYRAALADASLSPTTSTG